jgi:hypothetical protein
VTNVHRSREVAALGFDRGLVTDDRSEWVLRSVAAGGSVEPPVARTGRHACP